MLESVTITTGKSGRLERIPRNTSSTPTPGKLRSRSTRSYAGSEASCSASFPFHCGKESASETIFQLQECTCCLPATNCLNLLDFRGIETRQKWSPACTCFPFSEQD